MSSIRLDMKMANSALDDFPEYRQSVSSCIATIRSIKSYRCMRGGHFAGIYRSLNSVIAGLENQKMDLRSLERALSDVLREYSQCEAKVESRIRSESFQETSAGGGGQGTQNDKWNYIRPVDFIRRFFEELILRPVIPPISILPSIRAMWKQLVDNGKIEGALLCASGTTAGTVLGFVSKTAMEGELFGASAKTKGEAKWKPEKGEASLEGSIEGEAHLAKGSVKRSIGYYTEEYSGTLGVVGATGKAAVSLYKDGKLSPAIDAKLKAEAAVLKGKAGKSFGTEDTDVHVKGSGTVLGAEAEASGSVGVITYKDENGVTKQEFGVKGKVGAEAYVAKGKVSGGFKLLGIDFNVGVSGTAGGVGATAEGQITTGGVSGKIGGSLGVGGGLEFSIDWSGFSRDKLKWW